MMVQDNERKEYCGERKPYPPRLGSGLYFRNLVHFRLPLLETLRPSGHNQPMDHRVAMDSWFGNQDIMQFPLTFSRGD